MEKVESVGGAERREFAAVKSDNGEENFITYFKSKPWIC